MASEGSDTNLQYAYKIDEFDGNITHQNNNSFSTVGFCLTLKRHYAKQILTYYFPSWIFVVVSWVSFIIPPGAIPGRMALLITTLLVLVNLLGNSLRSQPASKFATLIDYWFIGCILFVTASLFSYALLMYKTMWKRTSRIRPGIKPAGLNLTNTDQQQFLNSNGNGREREWDKNCLIGFPVAFLVFNLIYWPIATTRQ